MFIHERILLLGNLLRHKTRMDRIVEFPKKEQAATRIKARSLLGILLKSEPVQYHTTLTNTCGRRSPPPLQRFSRNVTPGWAGSIPQLQLARLVFAASFLRRVDVFRQLLQVMSAVAIPGSCLVGAGKAAPVAMLADVAAAAMTVVLLGSFEARSWCSPELSDRDESATHGRRQARAALPS